MDTEELRQLLINMGSELELNDANAEQYSQLKSRGLVVFYDDKIYKTDKGRKAIIDPTLIVL